MRPFLFLDAIRPYVDAKNPAMSGKSAEWFRHYNKTGVAQWLSTYGYEQLEWHAD
jgi:hypothetical protein